MIADHLTIFLSTDDQWKPTAMRFPKRSILNTALQFFYLLIEWRAFRPPPLYVANLSAFFMTKARLICGYLAAIVVLFISSRRSLQRFLELRIIVFIVSLTLDK